MYIRFATCDVPARRYVLTADLGVASLIAAQSHTFAEIDNEIISTFR